MQIDLGAFGGSALTDASIAVPEDGASGAAIPVTYVPARNTVFLSFALAWAEVLQAHDIFIGVNAVDYSGYPDCRPEFIAAFARMANLATREGVEGTRTAADPHAADRPDQGRDHPPRRRPWASISARPFPATRPTRRAGPVAAAIPADCARPGLRPPVSPIPPFTADRLSFDGSPQQGR